MAEKPTDTQMETGFTSGFIWIGDEGLYGLLGFKHLSPLRAGVVYHGLVGL